MRKLKTVYFINKTSEKCGKHLYLTPNTPSMVKHGGGSVMLRRRWVELNPRRKPAELEVDWPSQSPDLEEE